MRIIGGSARGTKLVLPRRAKLRPTTDRVKESLFSMLADTLPDARVLDLFAGTGSIGIEALSRGAAYCAFVDSNHECTRTIELNLEKAHLAEQADVVTHDAYRICSYRPLLLESFDLIYLDPPYADTADISPGSRVVKLMRGISRNRLLASGGLVVLETDSRSTVPKHLPGLVADGNRSYGDTTLSFFVSDPDGVFSADLAGPDDDEE